MQEGPSSATRHACDTANAASGAGLMGAAIAAAALTRFLASLPPLLAAGPLATRQVALGAVHVFGGLVQALQTGDVAGLSDTLEAASTSLACHAQRAPPQRDRQTGRLPLGLAPLLESHDLIECAEAA
ncbi:MAG TPA: hypothetical protein VLQ80_06095 [Candidatus Saccharimonadia bacterium]|nr:hypothetical protein [Candidatus Saccharimonadia bacterium]